MAKELTLSALEREFKRYQKQKAGKDGGVEPRTLLNICQYAGEQTSFIRGTRIVTAPRDRNQPQLNINVLKKRVDKVIGKLASIDPVFKAQPDTDDPEDIVEGEVVEKLDKGLDKRLRETRLRRKRWWWLALGGSAFEVTTHRPDETVEPTVVTDPVSGEVLWQDNVTEEVMPESQRDELVLSGIAPPERFEPLEELDLEGDIHTEIHGPLTIFCPDSIESLSDLAPDQSVMVAKIRTREWVEENYPEFDFGDISSHDEFKIVTTDLTHVGDTLSGNNIKRLMPIIQGSKAKEDPDMFLMLDRYQPVSTKHPRGWSNSDTPELAWGGRFTTFIPGVGVLHDGELPYEDGIPIKDYHWDPVTTTFWTGGLVEHMVPAQKAFNRNQQDIRKIGNAYIKLKLLVGTGFDMDEWDPDSTHPVEGGLDEEGRPKLRFMDAPIIPPWFLQQTEELAGFVTELAGGGDLFDQQRFPGNLRGSMAIPILLEMSDTEWKPLLEDYGEMLSEVKQQRINRVKQFWPPVRTMHYFSRQGREEVLTFHTKEILRAGVNYNISVVRSSLMPELASMREARLVERLNSPLQVLYIDERAGAFDKEAIAEELEFGPTSREAKLVANRKFAKQIVSRILKAKPVPPVLPQQPHGIILDELEAVINDLDFFRMSPQIQQALSERAEQHSQILSQQAEQQQAAMMQQQTEAATQQAIQQASARLQAEAVDSIREEVRNTTMQFLQQQLSDQAFQPRSPSPGETL